MASVMSQDFPESTSAGQRPGQWPEGPGPQWYGQQPGQAGPGATFPGYQQAVQGFPVNGGQGYGPRGASDDNMWALASYLSPIIVSFLGPLIIYLIKKDESPYVRYHAAQSLNLIITSTIYGFGIFIFGILLAVVTHGVGILALLPLYLAFGVLTLVYLILASIGASRGELYRIPAWLCIKMVR
jgi:uncharacterized Tic20 family protein